MQDNINGLIEGQEDLSDLENQTKQMKDNAN